jgi:hypothetical protein
MQYGLQCLNSSSLRLRSPDRRRRHAWNRWPTPSNELRGHSLRSSEPLSGLHHHSSGRDHLHEKQQRGIRLWCLRHSLHAPGSDLLYAGRRQA